MNDIYKISEAIINESIKPFDAYLKLREISDTALELMKQIKASAIDDLKENGGKYEDEKLTIVIHNSAGTWNFKNIPEWTKKKKELEEIESNAKDAFKAWEKGKTIIEEGEIITPALYKQGDETLIFKKK